MKYQSSPVGREARNAPSKQATPREISQRITISAVAIVCPKLRLMALLITKRFCMPICATYL